MGILYASAIKGQYENRGSTCLRGPVAKKDILESVIINREFPDRGLLEFVDSFEVAVRTCGVDTAYVELYRNPFSSLKEYWLYCPEIFNEAYPGNTDDYWRAIQTLVYRRVVLEFIKRGQQARKTFNERSPSIWPSYFVGDKLIFSLSEVNTTLVVPEVIEAVRDGNGEIIKGDGYGDYEGFKDLLIHHYNHTIVPAGMPYYKEYMLEALSINKKFRKAARGGKVDLVKITGMVSDFITGCSSLHTRILREDIFREFPAKVVEDDLFGNSEGSYIKRWQGKQIQAVLKRYMAKVGIVGNYDVFFDVLNDPKHQGLRSDFIKELLEAKGNQKSSFIDSLLEGTFGEVLVTRQEFEAAGLNIEAMPFFGFVRRLVDYKCCDFIIDILYDEKARKVVKEQKAIIILGGRPFDGWAHEQKSRVKRLIKDIDPEMKFHVFFIDDHNVFTSWLIQQAVDFGGMLSWKGKEAGPTSFSNAQQNLAPVFATLDGVIPERMVNVIRDEQGFPVRGTGYIVDYEEKPNEDGQIKPKKQSFMKQLAAACQDYHNGKAYAAVAFDSLRMGLTQGDIRNQAKGLISLWADQLIKKKAVVNSGAYPAFSRLPVKKPTVHLEKSHTSAGFLITSIEKTIIIIEPAGVRRLLYRDSAFGLGEQNAVISKVEDMLKSILIHAPGRKKVKVVVSGQWQKEVFSFQEDASSITFSIHWALFQEGIGSLLLEDIKRHEIKELLTGSHDKAVQHSYDYFLKNPEKLESFFETLDKKGIQLDSSYQNALSILLFEQMGRKISNALRGYDSRISRPINLLFIGDPGVLKSTIIEFLSKVLREAGLKVADAVNPVMRNDLDEAYRNIGDKNNFNAFDEKYACYDVVIAEAVSKPPADGQNIDLLIRLKGSLSFRQQRIAEGSGSYNYAQLRTEVSAVSLDFRQPDIILDTDFIDRDKLDINWIGDTFRKTVKINLSSMTGTINVNSFMDGIISNHNDPEGDVALRGLRINTYYGQNVFLNGIDEVALTYIFEEIFANALRFSPPQGTVSIETSTVELSGRKFCSVKIIDEGSGMVPEDVKRFCQNEETTRPDEDEGGRGLFIAETFINKYRGKLIINSDLGKGTSVTVMLPAALEANHGTAEVDLSASGSKFLARDTVDRIIERAMHRKDNLGHLRLDVSADDKFLKRFFKESPHAYMYERISRYLEKMRVEIHILKGLPHKGYWQVDLSDENEPVLKIFVNNGEKEDFGLIAIHETAAAVTAVFAEPMTGKIIPTSHKTNCEIEADYVVWYSRCKNSIVFRYMSGMGFDYRFSTRAKDEIIGIARGNIDFSAGKISGCLNYKEKNKKVFNFKPMLAISRIYTLVILVLGCRSARKRDFTSSVPARRSAILSEKLILPFPWLVGYWLSWWESAFRHAGVVGGESPFEAGALDYLVTETRMHKPHSIDNGSETHRESIKPGMVKRIALIIWIPVIFISLSFLFGAQYIAFVKHSLLFRVIANIFVGGLSRASGMYARQILEAEGIDWGKILRWGLFGGIYVGVVVFGGWYWVLTKFVDSVFWKVFLDVVVFAAVVGLPSNFFIHKYLVAKDKSSLHFKDTVKDYLRLYICNLIFWAIGLSMGWFKWPQYIVLIAANMGLFWSGVLVYFLDIWLVRFKNTIDRGSYVETFCAVEPGEGETTSEQLRYCLRQMKPLINSGGKVVKQTILFKAGSSIEFREVKKLLQNELTKFFGDSSPPTSFIAQRPLSNKQLFFEARIITPKKGQDVEIEYKDSQGVKYTVVKHDGLKWVYAAGITDDAKQDRLSQSQAAFEIMESILKEEGLKFNDVLRQWNYIEDIVGYTADGTKQMYQIFNDVRSLYYAKADFSQAGYPAATGIGTQAGGIVLEFIALDKSARSDVLVAGIKNLKQINAHEYRQRKLEGEAIEAVGKKTTPKFERAKIVLIEKSGRIYVYLYISGTASIRGEDTQYTSVEFALPRGAREQFKDKLVGREVQGDFIKLSDAQDILNSGEGLRLLASTLYVVESRKPIPEKLKSLINDGGVRFWSVVTLEEGSLLSDVSKAIPVLEAPLTGNDWVGPDIKKQTQLTVDNIEYLISSENLSHLENLGENYNAVGADLSDSLRMKTYVKEFNDGADVKQVFNEGIAVLGDVCRPDLLVEIEGEAGRSVPADAIYFNSDNSIDNGSMPARSFKVSVRPDESYEVIMSQRVFDFTNPLLAQNIAGKKAFYVVDNGVGEKAISNIKRYNQYYGIESGIMIVPGGESVKEGLEWAYKVIEKA
ncbi:MAG: ATP-binding protein, partial [Candidatus Omnitrophota bacterium]